MWSLSWSYWLLKHNKTLLSPFLFSDFWQRRWSGHVNFLLDCLLAQWVHSAAVTPESLQGLHAQTYFYFFCLSYSLNLPWIWRCFYFILEGLSNKCYHIQLLYTIFLGWSFPLVNYTCVQCTGLGFLLLIRYFSIYLILPIFPLFPMGAYYYTMLECEKVFLGNFIHFYIWAISVLLLFLFVLFHHLFSKFSFSGEMITGTLRFTFLSL